MLFLNNARKRKNTWNDTTLTKRKKIYITGNMSSEIFISHRIMKCKIRINILCRFVVSHDRWFCFRFCFKWSIDKNIGIRRMGMNFLFLIRSKCTCSFANDNTVRIKCWYGSLFSSCWMMKWCMKKGIFIKIGSGGFVDWRWNFFFRLLRRWLMICRLRFLSKKEILTFHLKEKNLLDFLVRWICLHHH